MERCQSQDQPDGRLESRVISPRHHIHRFELYDHTVPTLTTLKRVGLGIVIASIIAMWIYAFFLSPRESINRVGDRSWSSRAEHVCIASRVEISGLADTRRIESTVDLLIRADLVERATNILERMLGEVFRTLPIDEKGLAISQMWKADYSTYLQDRRSYIAQLRNGMNEPFAETQVEGIPLSEKLGTFARANNMGSCAPPSDLSV